MFDRLNSHRWWWCALSGLLLVASFAPFSCATCGWISLVPAWWVISRSERVRRQPIRHGYLTGLIYFGGTFWWISNVTAIGTFFLILYLALYPAIWFLLAVRLVINRKGIIFGNPIYQAIAAAALWVTLEWWRSWFLTGFNWNELGISQSPSIIFRQLAAYGGVHLISFILVTVNILWAEGLLDIMRNIQTKRPVHTSLSFGTALFVVAFCFALCLHHLNRHHSDSMSAPLSFACVQPNIQQIPYDGKGWDAFQTKEEAALAKTVDLTAKAITGTDKPQLLIWPEATIDEGVFQDRPLNEAVRDICHGYDGYFLLGSQDFDLTGGPKKVNEYGKLVPTALLYNCAYLFGPEGDNYQEYRKTRLVILGEFVPFRGVFTWLLEHFPSLRKEIPIGMDFTPGPGPVVFNMEKPDVKIAPLICFEDTLAPVADKVMTLRDKPDIFVTITNDGWYWGWYAAWGIRQHLNHAVFRCVEHDRPMIRCANTGISDLIDQDGQVVDRFRTDTGEEIDVSGIFARKFQYYPAHPTFYESWGDWIVLLSSLITAILGIRFFCRPNES